ncbi:lipid binding protein [Microcystis phage Mel-JY34]
MSLKILKHRLMESSPDGTDPGPGAGDSPSSSEDKWGTLAESLDFDYGDGGEGQDADPSPAAAAQPAPAPKAEPKVAATPPVQPEPAAAPPEAAKAPDPAPQAQPQPPQPAAEPPVDLAAQRSTLRGTLVQRYALSEEMAERALTDPGAVLPELAADLQLNVTEAVTYGVMSTLPQILDQLLAQRESRVQGESAFFGKWKELNTDQGRKAVQTFGQAFRQLYPNASPEEFIEKVGATAMLSLGLNPTRGDTPAAPAAVPAPPPPAAPGGASPLPGRKTETNKFTILAEELLDDQD